MMTTTEATYPNNTKFPAKLHCMMSFVESNGLENIISWVMDGHGFRINDPEKLVGLLPIFFQQTKYRSFRRQLNMWHFERVEHGPNKGTFTHPYFIRGHRGLCNKMSRQWSMQPTSIKDRKTQQLSSLSFSARLDRLSSGMHDTKAVHDNTQISVPDHRKGVIPHDYSFPIMPEPPSTQEEYQYSDASSDEFMEPTPLKCSPTHKKHVISSQIQILNDLHDELQKACNQDDSFKRLCFLLLASR